MAGSSSSMSGLGGLARSMGLSRSSTGQEEDAIIPMLYPNLMNSQTFLVSLFDIPVESKDGKIKTTYYDYLAHHQKTSWWAEAKAKFFNLFSFSDDEKPAPRIIKTDSIVNPTALNKHQSMIMKAIASKIVCDVDKKTMVISITVTDQDPVICTTVADSTCQRLQNFIIDYRTKKAKAEYEHMLEQTEIAKQEYEEAKDELAAFNDANWDLVDGDLIVQRQGMQNDVQLRFSAYSTMNTQLLMARSKLDEARPVFTVLDGAAVPLQPIGPQKKKIVVGFLIFVCFIQCIIILLREYRKSKNTENEYLLEGEQEFAESNPQDNFKITRKTDAQEFH